MSKPIKCGVFSTHPIQYWVPIYKELAAYSDVDLEVYYLSMHSVEGGLDVGFGQKVQWDVPLLEGYDHTLLDNSGKGANGLGFMRYRAKGLFQLFREEKFDAILIPGYFCCYYIQVLLVARLMGVPAFFRGDNKDSGGRRGVLKNTLRSTFLRNYYRCFAGLFATATYMKQSFMKYGASPSKIHWAPHCVDSSLFEGIRSEMGDRAQFRERMGVGEEVVVLMLCGKMIEEKNPVFFLNALAKVKSESPTYLMFVGDGPLREMVELEAERLGISFTVTGFKNQTELPQYYDAADVVVLPSKSETWGLVINEAMIFGKPVVVSDAVGCCEDLVIEAKNGFIFRSEDQTDCVRALEACLGARKLYPEMGLYASSLIQNYTPAINAANIRDALKMTCLNLKSL